MRVLSTSSLGILTTATLLLSAAPPATASDGAAPDTPARPVVPPVAPAVPAAPAAPVAGSTQSLPLTQLAPSARGPRTGADGARGLTPRTVRPFSLLGVVWEDADAELAARVQVRTRTADTGRWSRWHDLDAHSGDAPDGGPREQRDARVRGATAPLWAGPSDGVQVRVAPETAHRLPDGLRLELIDPGEPGPVPGAAEPGSETGDTDLPALTRSETRLEAAAHGLDAASAEAGKHIGPRPGIVTRKGWRADERLRESRFQYTKTVRMAFVHHTAASNNYRCSQAPSIIRGIYRYHVKSSGWRDIGYNFLVDKCGKIYEGRAGGVTRPVQGAHTYGFNVNTMGVAVLGSFGSAKPPAKALDGVAKLTAWKLGLYGVNARGKTAMTSGGGKYAKGKRVRMHTISGHRDGFNTECPGAKLYKRLGTIRATAARLQGR